MKHCAIFVIAAAILHVVIAVPLETCPAPKEIDGCHCYPVSRRIVCKSLIRKFALEHSYKLYALTIENVQDLSLLVDHTIAHDKLHVDSLIIRQTAPSNTKIPSMDVLQEVLSISTQSVKIYSDLAFTDPLDIEDLGNGELISLIIENVNSLSNFDVKKYPKLEQLKIINTNIHSPDDSNFVIEQSPIKFLELTNTNIDKSFSFSPKDCDNEKIFLKIRHNKKLTSFDFSTLILNPTAEKCRYHIDLSENTNLDKEILNTQMEFFKEFFDATGNKNNLYLIMKKSNVVSCSCDFYQFYKIHSSYIHGINCETDKNDLKNPSRKFQLPIDELDETKFENCKLNSEPTTAGPTTAGPTTAGPTTHH